MLLWMINSSNRQEMFKKYFLRVIRTLKQYSDMFLKNHLEVYMAYLF